MQVLGRPDESARRVALFTLDTPAFRRRFTPMHLEPIHPAAGRVFNTGVLSRSLQDDELPEHAHVNGQLFVPVKIVLELFFG